MTFNKSSDIVELLDIVMLRSKCITPIITKYFQPRFRIKIILKYFLLQYLGLRFLKHHLLHPSARQVNCTIVCSFSLFLKILYFSSFNRLRFTRLWIVISMQSSSASRLRFHNALFFFAFSSPPHRQHTGVINRGQEKVCKYKKSCNLSELRRSYLLLFLHFAYVFYDDDGDTDDHHPFKNISIFVWRRW